jgi:hypothetical protein
MVKSSGRPGATCRTPTLPSTRYGEIAPRVKAICERYERPYNTEPLLRAARPKPYPFRAAADGDAAQAAMPTSAGTSSSATAA